MVELAERDLEAVAYWIGQTLDTATKYDRHSRSRGMEVDIQGTRWHVLELLRKGFRQEDIIQISDKVGWLKPDGTGKKFLNGVIRAAQQELLEPELSQHRYRSTPVQLKLPFDYGTLAQIIRDNYSVIEET